jgi:hypothetical protein
MATLVVMDGEDAGKSYEVSRALVLGREKADVPVKDIGASRAHCKVFSQAGEWAVVDLGSRNGTVVNGEKVARATLFHGDTILIGKTRFRLDAPEAPRPAPAAPAPPAARPASPSAPRGPSAVERERERLRAEKEAKRTSAAPAAAPAAGDGSGIVVRETVLQYGRIENRGGLLADDVAQRGGLFKVALVLGMLGLGAAIVYGIVRLNEKTVVEDPDVPEEATGR